MITTYCRPLAEHHNSTEKKTKYPFPLIKEYHGNQRDTYFYLKFSIAVDTAFNITLQK